MSIFNFKRRADEPYELGDLIGKGSSCDFYKIKNEKLLGVKVFHNREDSLISSVEEQIKNFEREIEIGNLLRRFNIPTPRYVGIIDVYNSKKREFVKGLVIEIIGDETAIVVYCEKEIDCSFNYFTNQEFFLRIYTFESYAEESEIEPKLLEKYKIAVCNTLNLMIKTFNPSKEKLAKNLDEWDLQGLYSSKTDIFYLIDFELWENFS